VAAGAPASAQAGAAAPTAAPLTHGKRRGPSVTPRRQQATALDAGRRLRLCCPGLTRRARARGRGEQKECAPQGKDGRRRAAAALVRRPISGGSEREQSAKTGRVWPWLAARISLRSKRGNQALLRPSARVPSCRDGRSGMSMETRAFAAPGGRRAGLLRQARRRARKQGPRRRPLPPRRAARGGAHQSRPAGSKRRRWTHDIGCACAALA